MIVLRIVQRHYKILRDGVPGRLLKICKIFDDGQSREQPMATSPCPILSPVLLCNVVGCERTRKETR